MTAERPFISTITGVREVALTATADLAYWAGKLRAERLVPYNDDGRASLLLTAIESTFRGIPFREMSISVLVSDDGATPAGAYLAHAYNSSRLLTFAERVLLHTPYHLADLIVDERVPARLGVSRGDRVSFTARMNDTVASGRAENMLFDGPIYLPGGRQVFYARLSGAGHAYPFAAADEMKIESDTPEHIFGQLLESDVKGKAWLLRAGAVHARSKTYRRQAE
ncbi:MAG: hypothetical protein KA586_00790 [Candidatus Promineofilum sp.]|nr:hypothetical protein [Promineifilum sp.]